MSKTVYGLIAVCGLLAVTDLLYHKHVHEGFDWEGWFNFYGFYGLAACVAIVFVAKAMRVLLSRDEDYYDR